MHPSLIPDKALTPKQLAYVSRKVWRLFPDDDDARHARHCEIEDRKRRKPFNIGSAFISAMYVFIVDQFGALSLSDDDWGWEVLWEYLNQYRLKNADERTLRGIANEVIPELSDDDVAIMIEEIGEGRKVKCRTLAAVLGLDFDTRDRLYLAGCRSILCIPCTDKTKAECAAIYAKRRAEKKRRERLEAKTANPRPKRKRGRPSLGDPWLADGISRRTWFRQQNRPKVALNSVALNSRPHNKDNSAAKELVPTTVAERGAAADRGETGLPVAPSRPRQSQPKRKTISNGKPAQDMTPARRKDASGRSEPKAPCDTTIRMDWTPPPNYGQAFDPTSPPDWAIAMRKLTDGVAAGTAPAWMLPVLRSPSRRAA
jgi:hypothetical protein